MTSTDPQATASPLITADLARAGRALAQVSAAVIAARTGLEAEDVRAFERGVQDLAAPGLQVVRADAGHGLIVPGRHALFNPYVRFVARPVPEFLVSGGSISDQSRGARGAWVRWCR